MKLLAPRHIARILAAGLFALALSPPEPAADPPGSGAASAAPSKRLARGEGLSFPDLGLYGGTNELHRVPDGALDDAKAAVKTPERVLVRRWLSANAEVRGGEVEARRYRDRTLERYFTNTDFYRFATRIGRRELIGYGCVSLGEPLILPDEINLLLILENRPVTRFNVKPLSEVIVRLADPEGAATMNVVGRRIERSKTTEGIEKVELVTWSYKRGMKKRWTLVVDEPYFHSLEEKLLRYRPEMYESLGKSPFLDGTDVAGPSDGDQKYIVFWRNPDVRGEMRETRRDWLDMKRASRRRSR